MRHLVPSQYPIETDFYGDPIQSYVVPAAEPVPANPKRRAALYRLENELKKLIPFECPLEHRFIPGVYIRTMFIPAGVALVGHIHRHPCMNIVQYGEIEVATEAGRKRIIGPVMFESLAGMKRAGYALKDTLWTTIHHNPENERDVDNLLTMITVEDYNMLEEMPT
jgi:hypothetical protein